MEFSAKLHRLGQEANLESLMEDDIYMFHYISGCTDRTLQNLFLQEELPNLAKLNEIAERQKATQNNKCKIRHPTNSVARI